MNKMALLLKFHLDFKLLEWPNIVFPLGWGKIKHPGSSYHILQQAMMPPIDNTKCKQKIQASGGKLTKTSARFTSDNLARMLYHRGDWSLFRNQY